MSLTLISSKVSLMMLHHITSSYHNTLHHIMSHHTISHHIISHHIAYVHYRCRWCVREHHHRATETLHQHAHLHGGVLGHTKHGANGYVLMKHYFNLITRLTQIGFIVKSIVVRSRIIIIF